MPNALPASGRPQRHYLPTLDGWRALSIAAVILSHDRIHQAGPFSTRWLHDHGQAGVDIFFAISGLLICSRLLSEEAHKGRIDVRGFYIRRAFRILPPAVVYLAALACLARLIALPVGLPEIASSLFFVRNYTFTFQHFQTIYPYYTSQFWSLAVEEHFYLLLPPLLLFTPKRWRAAALIAIAAVVALHRLLHDAPDLFHTDMRLDALLVPAAMAVALRSSAARGRAIPWLRFWPIAAMALTVILSIGKLPRLEPLALAWLSPILILGTMLRPRSLFAQFLELAPLRFLGRMSYSIYLWQQLFFVAHYGATASRLAWLQSWPACLLATLGIAAASYYWIERPCMELGHRLARSRHTAAIGEPSHPISVEA